MTFIFPMAGHGSRFVKQGFKIPKYMIEVKGKTLFEYSIESLPLEIADKIIFICLKEHEAFNVSQFIKNRVNHPNIEIIALNSVTRGQAETVLFSKNHVDMNDEIVIYNIDTSFNSKKLKELLLDDNLKKDGVLGAFVDRSDDNKWSFAKLDQKGKVICTTEKEKISDYALTGLYHFSKAEDFFITANKWIEEGKTIKNEFYIAPMYNDLIAQGKEYVIDIADTFTPLGTPEEVKEFESKN
ncbi:hypothetical protein CRV08_06040 [Halarcobacter ebronensis]|uniref:Nucleotidyl transferase domain-containing protein n=1 Tax=Halarcobacter ebronensis TaxID=1462615 RepID=A0A4Q0YIR1_9BACT|nr:glycosyltransferase family 2 protein [Halarcobacter ebronensis]RXJ68989.1 hypothetical protein CRV08_06040 [Halarcobacter ebronensis]